MTSAPDTDDRTALLHFLDANRAAALAVLDGLSEEDAQRSIVPSGWTPFDLTVHLAGVERHWFAYALDGDEAHTPALDGDPSDAGRGRRAAAGRGAALRSDPEPAEPGRPAHPAARRAGGRGDDRTGVLLHVIEEIARHAGHLDIARELLDGRTGLGPR